MNEHIDNEGVDKEVWIAYCNIIRAKTLLPIREMSYCKRILLLPLCSLFHLMWH